MKIIAFNDTDYDLIKSWIKNREDCLFWAGPLVAFPLEKKDFLKQEDSYMYFLEKEKKKIAFIQIVINKNKARLCKVFVKKEERSKGYSKILVSLLIEKYLNEFNIKYFDLNVFTNNSNAVLSYKSLGFKIINSYDFIDKSNNKIWPVYKMSLEY